MSYPPQSNPPQPYLPQGQVPAPMQQAPTPLKKGRNTVGIVALAMAVIGFIFACVPGALIVGWILLPTSFIICFGVLIIWFIYTAICSIFYVCINICISRFFNSVC